MTEIIARRAFSPLYIVFDIAFLVIFAGLLLWKKRYMTVLVGFLAGLLYMIVDYGIFHLVCHSRYESFARQLMKASQMQNRSEKTRLKKLQHLAKCHLRVLPGNRIAAF